MKTLIQVVAFSLISILGYSQKSAFPDFSYSNLFYVAADGDHIISVGSCDLAQYSANGGESWKDFPVGIQFTDMAILPGTDAKKVLLSYNFDLYLMDVDTEDVTEVTPSGLVIGRIRNVAVSNGQVLLTGDIGVAALDADDFSSVENIGEFDYPSNDFIRGAAVSDSYVYSYSNEGLLFRTSVDGSGTTILEGVGEKFRSLAMGSDLVGYASFNAQNKPWKTVDGGVTWTELSQFSEAATMMAYNENVVMSRNTNRILLSEDGGATVEYIPYMNTSETGLIQNHYFDNADLYLCGKGSMVLKSTDFGRTYDNLIDINRSDFADIDFNESGVGVAVGGEDLLVTTSDGGESWSTIDVDLEEDQYFYACQVLPNGVSLAAHDGGVLAIDENGYTTVSDETLQAIKYVPDDNSLIGVKVQGATRVIRKSVDGGVTWETKGVLESFPHRIHVSQLGTIAIGGSDGIITISNDNGESWETQQLPVTNAITDINIYSDELMLFCNGNELHKSTDGGVTSSTLFSSYIPRNIVILDEENYLVSQGQNSQTQVRRSENGGSTWTTVASYCEAANDGILHDGFYWTAHRAGHINTFEIDPVTSTTEIIESRQWIVNTMVQLGNPIRLDASIVSNAVASVFDQSGRLVKSVTLKSSGNHVIETSGLDAGLYFVQFAAGSTRHSERVVVVR